MKTNTYDHLDQLVNAYFHQDWPDEYSSEEAVFADYVRSTWRDEVERTIAQIERYLTEHPVGLLASFESDFNPMITIGFDDVEARNWLEVARAHLARLISTSPVRQN